MIGGNKLSKYKTLWIWTWFLRCPSKWNTNQVKAKTNMLKKTEGSNYYIWNLKKYDPNKILELESLTTHANCQWHGTCIYFIYMKNKGQAGDQSKSWPCGWRLKSVFQEKLPFLRRGLSFSFYFKTGWSPSTYFRK